MNIIIRSDQPVTCPKCGARSELVEELGNKAHTSIEECLGCEHRFFVEDDIEQPLTINEIIYNDRPDSRLGAFCILRYGSMSLWIYHTPDHTRHFCGLKQSKVGASYTDWPLYVRHTGRVLWDRPEAFTAKFRNMASERIAKYYERDEDE